MSNDEEMSLTQDWMRVRAHSDYETSVSTAMLFDSMAAHLMSQMMSLMSIGGDKSDRSSSRNLSEAQREKVKRDLATEATWYLQQAESVEKQKFVGMSSEWYHHLVAGLQYYCKKDDSKAAGEFKLSLSLFESRAARIGQALVYLRSLKYVEALEEFSRVYTSIYASYKEEFAAHNVDGLQPSGHEPRTSSANDRYNPTADYEWFKSNDDDVRTHGERSVKLEFLTTYAPLRPLMALVWFKMGATQRAIDILKLQLESVEDGMYRGFIHALPPHHDSTLAMIGILELNKHTEMMQRAKSVEDVENAGTFLRDSVEHFKRAFQLNPDNPNVLNHLSNIFFTQKRHEERDWDKIDGFAQRAKDLAQQSGWKEICAESCYYLGRSAHARGKHATARQHYMDSLVFSHNFPLPRFALAQLSFGDKDYTSAIEHLAKLDSKVPDLPDTKAFLGKIHLLLSQSPSSPSEYQTHYSSASKLLSRAIQLNPSLIAPHMDLAQLKERTSPLESLSSYLLASDLVFQHFLTQSGVELELYKKTAADMYDVVVHPDTEQAKMISKTLYPPFIKRLNLLSPRTVYNNVSVMRMTNNLYAEAKDSILRTILLGACTLGANDASTLTSKQASSIAHFVNPSTYAASKADSLEVPLVFSALFGRSLRELLPSSSLSLLETFVLDSGVLTLPLNLTAAYNLGLIYEKLGDSRAEHVYELLISRYPHYLDAKLRFAIFKRDSGQGEAAQKLLKAIMSESSDESEKARSPAQQQHRENSKSMAGILLASILMERKELKETQTMLDALVNKMSGSSSKASSRDSSSSMWTFGCDVYSLTQYANFFLATSYSSPNREKNLKWASSLFASVLKQTPGNFYAANGLAIITALLAKDEMANLEGEGAVSSSTSDKSGSRRSASTKWNEKSRSAMNAFLAIREACPNLADVLINLGHLSFCVGDYRGAAKHYQMAWTKLGGASSQVIKMGQVTPMLARCLYEMGHFEQAKLILESHLLPRSSSSDMDLDKQLGDDKDEDLWFNLAVMCKEWAMQLLQRVDLSLSRVQGKSSGESVPVESESGEVSRVGVSSMSVESGHQSSGPSSSKSTSSLAILSSSSSLKSLGSDIRFLSAPNEDEQRKAIEMLHYAKPIFERLSHVNESLSVPGDAKRQKKISFSTKKCATLARLCEMNAELAEEKLKVYREEMESEKLVREEKRRAIELEEKELEEREAREEEEMRRQLQEENEKAEALRIKSQQMMEDWVSSGGGNATDDGRGKRKKTTTGGSRGGRNAYEDDEEQDEENARIARAARKQRGGGGGDDDQDDDDDGNTTITTTSAGTTSGNTSRIGADGLPIDEEEFDSNDETDDDEDGYWEPKESSKTKKDDDDEEEEGGGGGSNSSKPSAASKKTKKKKTTTIKEKRNTTKTNTEETTESTTSTTTATVGDDDNKRRSQLEALAARRNAAKRSHSEIDTDHSTTTSTDDTASATAATSSTSTDANESSAPSTKKRKLRDNKEKKKEDGEDEEDIDIPMDI